jgi:hypothetical protein
MKYLIEVVVVESAVVHSNLHKFCPYIPKTKVNVMGGMIQDLWSRTPATPSYALRNTVHAQLSSEGMTS